MKARTVYALRNIDNNLRGRVCKRRKDGLYCYAVDRLTYHDDLSASVWDVSGSPSGLYPSRPEAKKALIAEYPSLVVECEFDRSVFELDIGPYPDIYD